MNFEIGCCALVIYQEKILALDCAKNRGIILPGGKYEQSDQSFLKAAQRELVEETGVIANKGRLLFAGIAPDGCYDYCFHLWNCNFSNMKEESEAGKVLLVNKLDSWIWNPYYELVMKAYFNA